MLVTGVPLVSSVADDGPTGSSSSPQPTSASENTRAVRASRRTIRELRSRGPATPVMFGMPENAAPPDRGLTLRTSRHAIRLPAETHRRSVPPAISSAPPLHQGAAVDLHGQGPPCFRDMF